jgi:antitoxin component of RelBE/YafQ-DinJ toxin-antitoxin module
MRLETKIVAFRIDQRLWQAFMKAAHQRGLSASEVLRRFVSDYVRGDAK